MPEKRISATEALHMKFIRKYTDEADVADADLRFSVSNLKSFRVQMKFQKAVLTYCASQQLTQKAEAKLRKLFEIFDMDKDGKITKEELRVGYTNLYKDSKKASKDVNIIMKNIDVNNKGFIEYNGNSL